MIRRLLAVAVLVLSSAPLRAASWAHVHDAMSGPPLAVVAMRDQGFVIADSNSITRESANGSVLWSERLSSEGSIFFAAAGPGDDLYAGGSIFGDAGAGGWIARLNGGGKPLWSRHYDLAGSDTIMFRAAASMPDGGLAVCGLANHAGVVLRLAADGTIKWQSRFEISQESWLTSITASRDGGVIVGGRGGPAWLIAKLDRNGAMQWHRTMGTRGGRVFALAETRDGIVAGGTGGLVVKLANDGHTLWQREVEGTDPPTVYDVVELAGGALLATVKTDGLLIMKLSPAGGVIWQRLHGAVGEEIASSDLNGPNALATADGGAIVAVTGRQLRVLRLDADGHAGSDCAVLADVQVPLRPMTDTYAPIHAVLVPIRLKPGDAPLDPQTGNPGTATYCDPEQQRRLIASVGARSPAPAGPSSFDAVLDQKEKFRQDVAKLVIAKRFDDLDAMGEQLRTSHAMFEAFETKLEIFYQAIASPSIDAAVGEGRHLAILQEWRAAKPKSATAVVALATTLAKQGAIARGTGFANTVTEHGAAKYRQHLQRAGKVLDEGKAVAASDPQYWTDRIDVAQGKGLAIIRQSGSVGDWYPMLYFAAMGYALPQWGGTPDEYMALTEEAVRHTRAIYGDGMYGRFAWKLMLLAIDDSSGNKATRYGFSWPRIKAAYESLIQRYPKHIPIYHELAHLAYWHGDRETARAMFAKPELAWSRGGQRAWSDRNDYDIVRRWAAEEPHAAVAPASRPFGDDLAGWPRIVRNDTTFLVRTKSGVVAVSRGDDVHPLITRNVPALEPGALVLQVRSAPMQLQDRVYVVCTGPRQSVLEGTMTGRSTNSIAIDVPGESNWKNRLGCAVLDDAGLAVGAVTSVSHAGAPGMTHGRVWLLAATVAAAPQVHR